MWSELPLPRPRVRPVRQVVEQHVADVRLQVASAERLRLERELSSVRPRWTVS